MGWGHTVVYRMDQNGANNLSPEHRSQEACVHHSFLESCHHGTSLPELTQWRIRDHREEGQGAPAADTPPSDAKTPADPQLATGA